MRDWIVIILISLVGISTLIIGTMSAWGVGFLISALILLVKEKLE